MRTSRDHTRSLQLKLCTIDLDYQNMPKAGVTFQHVYSDVTCVHMRCSMWNVEHDLCMKIVACLFSKALAINYCNNKDN